MSDALKTYFVVRHDNQALIGTFSLDKIRSKMEIGAMLPDWLAAEVISGQTYEESCRRNNLHWLKLSELDFGKHIQIKSDFVKRSDHGAAPVIGSDNLLFTIIQNQKEQIVLLKGIKWGILALCLFLIITPLLMRSCIALQ